MSKNIRPKTLAGAAWGLILGDALGVPFEFRQRGTFECTDMIGFGSHDQPPGTWSDDSSMMLATCKSLRENELNVDIDDMRNRFIDWMDHAMYTPHGEVFDIGISTLWCILQADREPDDGKKYARCLMRAVNLGEDTDTVAAVTGGLAGLIWPIEDIPKNWIDEIKAKELIEDCLF